MQDKNFEGSINVDPIKYKEILETLERLILENQQIFDANVDSEIPEDFMDNKMNELSEKINLMSKMQNFKFKILNESATPPSYVYGGDSGFDLHSSVDIEIPPLSRAKVPTGLAFQFDNNHELQIRSKSGLADKLGLMVLNSPGTIDEYIGEIQVILFNTATNPVKIVKGMKIAQAVLCPVVKGRYINFVEVNELTQTERGSNGFGSTGV